MQQVIYSHMGIPEDCLNKNFETTLDTGETFQYSISYRTDHVVNMPFTGPESKNNCNTCGWLRDKNYFFNQLLEKHPELFSEENKWLIEDGEAPICDSTYVKHYPEYEPLIGEKLKHHHIGRDGQAVALPSSLHKGFGVVHNSEKEVGVTENGVLFSDVVLENHINGKEFIWEKDAEKHMKSVLEAKVKVENNEPEAKKEQQKESKEKAEPQKENIVKKDKPNVKPRSVKKRAIQPTKKYDKPDILTGLLTRLEKGLSSALDYSIRNPDKVVLGIVKAVKVVKVVKGVYVNTRSGQNYSNQDRPSNRSNVTERDRNPSTGHRQVHNRRDHPRALRKGHNASKEAKHRAYESGYKLKEGETFVRGKIDK